MDQPTHHRTGGRSPLFAALRRAMRMATAANTSGAPPVEDLIGLHEARLTRRRFLQTSAVVATTLGARTLIGPLGPAVWGAAARPGARVAIVGGGVAGLNAAYVLRKARIRATVYEGAQRTGGRMFSRPGALAPGLVTEFGGEFINTDHTDVLALVKEFDLPLMDMEAPGEANLTNAYVFGGQHYTEAQIIEAFRPIARRVAADVDRLPDPIDFQHPGAAALDRTSLAEYLQRVGATGWIGRLLDMAYVTEFGLDAGEQSALNFITLIGTDLSAGFKIVGESDERYKVRGGNQQIVDGLARRLDGQIRLGHRLTAIRGRGPGFTLSFERRGAGAVDVAAAVVIIAIPFTILREVEISVPLPAYKRRAIRELGYGTNAKLMLGLLERPWRARGFSGAAYSDTGFQLCWDNSRGQPGPVGGITLFSGGKPGLEVGRGTADEQAARLLPGVDGVFPGVVAARSGTAARWHWPTYPFTKASYACYKPGQWTSIRGAEGTGVGNLFFAGEHCSLDYQGFMNGGAETGRLAAAAVLRRLGLRRTG